MAELIDKSPSQVALPVGSQTLRRAAAQAPPAAETSAPRARMATTWLVVLLTAVAAASVVAYLRGKLGQPLPEGLLQVNGRIEGDSSTIASKLPGRIASLDAREGDGVELGQVLATLDDRALRARLAQAVAASDVARARMEAARAALVVMRREVPLTVARARAALTSTHARLAQARAAQAQAERDQARIRGLYDANSVDLRARERADLGLETAAQELQAGSGADANAEQALSEARLGPARVRASEAELLALEAALRQAQASVDEASSALEDLTIRSPIRGTITSRFIDPGEVVSPGTPMFEIVDLDRLYLKVFVPETEIGKARLGLPARIYTDAFPKTAFAAELRYIAARAEFTPKEVQTRDERVKLVYAAKLYIADNTQRRLSPGLSADAVIRWRKDAPWAAPRW
jgi:HlyD family secretion protein